MQRLLKFALTTSVAAVAIATSQIVSTRAASAADMYGAIATNDDGFWGYAYNYQSEAQAEAVALKKCGKSDCVVRVWFANACGAVAQNDKVIGWGWGDSRAEAEAQAITGCGTGDCKIVTWACTDR